MAGLELRVTAPEKAAHSTCYAPLTSMYFDPAGKVRTCCTMRGPGVGDVTRQSLRDIWDGLALDEKRRALAADRFPTGCEFCAWQDEEGNTDALFARTFDRLPLADAQPRWPTQMEFSLTNTCNLQCTMCSSGYSSAIRSQREGRPPMPKVYGDRFFAELTEFLPHLSDAQFFGGEPFLGRESLRVMELLAVLDQPPQVQVTTNGTVWSDQIEHLLCRLRPFVTVSLDGATAETFEAVRVGADHAEVMANLARYGATVGTDRIALTTCVMATNWREFPDICNLSSARSLPLGVNIVTYPAHLSLYQLGAAELEEVVVTLTARRAEVAEDRRDVYDTHVATLRNRLAAVERLAPDEPPGTGLALAPFMRTPELTTHWMWLPFPEQATFGESAGMSDPEAGAGLLIGTDGVVHVVDQGGIEPPLQRLDGGVVEDLFELVEAAYGPMERWYQAPRRLPEDSDHFSLRPGGAADPSLEIHASAKRDGRGRLIGARYRVNADVTALRRLSR